MERLVPLLCYWGGRFISKYVYDSSPKHYFNCQSLIKFDELVELFYTFMGVDRTNWAIKLSWKMPVTLGHDVKYCLLPLLTDENVQFMLNIPMSTPGVTCIEVFAEIEQMIQTTLNTDNLLMGRASFTRLLIENSPVLENNQVLDGDCVLDHGIRPNSNVGLGFDSGNNLPYHQRRPSSSHTIPRGASTSCQQRNTMPEFPELNLASNIDENNNGVNDRVNLQQDDEELATIQDIDNGNAEDENGEADEDEDGDEEGDGNNDAEGDREPRLHEPVSEYFNEFQPVHMGRVVEEPHEVVFNMATDELSVGAPFKSKKVLQRVVDLWHAERCKFYVVLRSDNYRWRIKCEFCNTFDMRAICSKRSNYWEIKKFEDHSCTFAEVKLDNRHITIKMIADMIQHQVKRNPAYRICDILAGVSDRLHKTVTYKRAWYAKQVALARIFGDWKESYNKMSKLLSAIVHYNPGSFAEIEAIPDNLDGIGHFQRAFWAFKPCIDGWQHARPIISIDATHLYGKYAGKVLVAMGYDPNNHQYPLAFGLVDSESTNNWGWFLRLLRRNVVRDRLHVCLLSDRAAGIIAAADNPLNGFTGDLGVHRFCLRHFKSNFMTAFKDDKLKYLCGEAAVTSQVRKFRAIMDQIKCLNHRAYEWLTQKDPAKWTLSHDGGYRWGVMDTNYVESYNSIIVKWRNLPVASMVQFIYYDRIKKFQSKRSLAIEGHEFVESARAYLNRWERRAGSHEVYCLNPHTYEVKTTLRLNRYNERTGGNKQVVMLDARTCTCGKFTNYRLPCSHLIAVCRSQSLDVRQYVHFYYKAVEAAKMWEPQFQPIYHEDYWTFGVPFHWSHFRNQLLPDERLRRTKRRGRRNATRIQTEMDRSNRRNKCGHCKQEGHNRATCPQLRQPDSHFFNLNIL